MFSNKDIETFKTKLEEYNDEINENKDNLFKKSNIVKEVIEEGIKCMDYIKQFIIDKKLVIYGGQAHHLALIKNKKKGIYDENEEMKIHDYDIYSPNPVQHGVELCNKLYDLGFKDIQIQDALHPETYTIICIKKDDKFGVYFEKLADITYTPNIIYNNLPFLEYNNMRFINPKFSYIDYFRLLADPEGSLFRAEKQLKRLKLMTDEYPFKENNEKINIELLNLNKMDNNLYHLIRKYTKNNKSLISVGLETYNKYVKLTKDFLTIKQKEYIETLDVKYFEFISGDYENDVIKFMEFLKQNLKDKEIGCCERYPFFQYRDYSTEIYVDKKLICIIYKNNNICVPFININGHQYGVFYYMISWFITESFYNRIYNDDRSIRDRTNRKDIENEYFKIISNMITLKNQYLNKNNLTIYDKSIFQGFTTNCIGLTIMASNIRLLEGINNKFKYNPENRKTEIKWVYRNLSGNYITNEKNCKIKID